MRQAPRKRSGLAAHFIGGTIVHPFVFCNGGLAGFFLDGWSCCGLRPGSTEGLAWPAPLSHQPTLQRFWVQGDSPYPRRGLRPLHLALGERRSVAFFTLARRGASQPAPGYGTGTVFDCMLSSFSAEFRGFRRGAVVYPSLSVVDASLSRRAAVADPSLNRMAPRSLCPTTACARVPTFLGWMRAWGTFPDPPAQGVSLWIPPVHLYAAGFTGIL